MKKQVIDYILECPGVWGLKESNLRAVELLKHKGMTYDKVAEELGVSQSRICRLCQSLKSNVEHRKAFAPRKCKNLPIKTIVILRENGIMTEADLRDYVESGKDLKAIRLIGVSRELEILQALKGE